MSDEDKQKLREYKKNYCKKEENISIKNVFCMQYKR